MGVYYVGMNIEERRNLTFRLIAISIVILNIGFVVWTCVHLFTTESQNQIISIIAAIFAFLMMVFEIVIFIRGKTKESALYKIAFNPNGNINNVPLFALGVFSLFGIGFLVLGSILYVAKPGEPYTTSALTILTVAVYLLSNIIIYFLYVWMFRKRPFSVKDLLK